LKLKLIFPSTLFPTLTLESALDHEDEQAMFGATAVVLAFLSSTFARPQV